MAALDKALTTLSRAKSFLGISGNSKDVLLTMLILGVSKAVETYCRRKFGYASYSEELYNGGGTAKLWVKNSPIDSSQTFLISRRTNLNNQDGWEDLESEDYFIDYANGSLTDSLGAFSEGTQNYRISYTGGYKLPSDSGYQDGTDDEKDLPYDLELAVLDLLKIEYDGRTLGAIKRQEVGNVKLEYGTVSKSIVENPSIKSILDSYKVPAYG